MSYVPASRFGQDMPTRIATSTPMLMEATDTLPGEPVVPALIPFLPTITTGSGASSGFILDADGNRVWTKFPSRLDLIFYQGDDVVIPLYIQDPNNPLMDMSDQAQWQWYAQIRVWHGYRATLVGEFTVDSEYIAPVPPDTAGKTLVQLFLPRELNNYWGTYQWELYSISPYDFSDFPEPFDWPGDEVWPPTTKLNTWLWGACTIQPRTSTTDVLPASGGTSNGGTVTVPAIDTGYMVVGPNGRVP